MLGITEVKIFLAAIIVYLAVGVLVSCLTKFSPAESRGDRIAEHIALVFVWGIFLPLALFVTILERVFGVKDGD